MSTTLRADACYTMSPPHQGQNQAGVWNRIGAEILQTSQACDRSSFAALLVPRPITMRLPS
ncbi:unnamed protein product [Diplocarpon coronariae]